jgi:hypothetical protein
MAQPKDGAARMAAVGRVTVHHEGAGAPTDDVGRFAGGGYCVGIGLTKYQVFRAPQDNWATIHWNGRDFTICLSGNRQAPGLFARLFQGARNYVVTNADLLLIAAACADARRRGWLTDSPEVVPHRLVFNTLCPGSNTLAPTVWAHVVAACQASHAQLPPAPGQPRRPVLSRGMRGADVRDLQHALNVVSGARLAEDGDYGPATAAKVANFQRWLHLRVDGVAGPQTFKALDAAYAAARRRGAK